jgi:hypothetical protein
MRSNRWTWWLTVLWVSCLAMPVALAQDDEPTDETRLSNLQIARTWDLNWKYFGSRYVKVGDDHLPLPRWEPRFPSSLHKTVAQIQEESARMVEQPALGGMVRRVRVTMSREEATALSVTLPNRATGHYGFIHSFRIVEILGDQRMIVDEMWLLDAEDLERQMQTALRALESRGVDRRSAQSQVDEAFAERIKLARTQRERVFRRPLVIDGIATRGLEVDTRWPSRPPQAHGFQIAMLGMTTVQQERRRPVEMPLAVPTDQLRQGGMDEAPFRDMLAARGIDVPAFARLVVGEKRRDAEQFQRMVFEAIEAARPAPEGS